MAKATGIMMLAAIIVVSSLAGAHADLRGPTFPDKQLPGEALVKEGRYAEAIPLLEEVIAADPENADAYNLLGYSHRKLGDRESALAFYMQALSHEPLHRGANEYLGELYLEMDDLAKAEAHLDILDRACWLGCEEYTELKEAIEAYKAANGG